MREGKTRRGAVTRIVVVGGVLITAAAAVALYTPWLGLFGLRQIIVSGNEHVSAETIGQAAGLRPGQPLLGISRGAVSSRIEQVPWIKQAFVQRNFPDGIRVSVTERDLVCWMSGTVAGECVMVGEGGVIVSTECEDSDRIFELVGARTTGSAPGARLGDGDVVSLVHALGEPAIRELGIQRIDVSDLSSVVLHAESGLRVLLGAVESCVRRVDALVALSRQIDVKRYASIDLRLEGEATLVTW